MTEHMFRTDADAHAARRAMIDRGITVSLVAFDGSRDVFVFDADVPAPVVIDADSIDAAIPDIMSVMLPTTFIVR